MADKGKIRYEADNDGIARWALSNDVGDVMFAFAQGGVEFARSQSPRSSDGDSHYQDAFSAARSVQPAGYKNEPRAGAIITNSSDHASSVEHSTHVMARTATALDGRQRYWNMDKAERASARRRVARASKTVRKRASSR